MTLLQIQFAVISRSVRQKAFVFHPISLNVQNPDVQHKPVNTFVSGLPPLSTPCPLPLGRPDTQDNLDTNLQCQFHWRYIMASLKK